MPHKLHWLDVEDIAELLYEVHADRDPLTVRFTELRRMVEALPDFVAQADHPVNEKILETIQGLWYEAFSDAVDEEEEE